ncbi:MAG: DNA translocase FtsK, partial [Patescibacteria group bacterium]
DIASYNKNIYEPAHAAAEAKKGSGDDEDETQEKPELPEAMPYIVIIIDELADIMSSYPRELESAIVRIAQMSRAVGIHLILSTQRPQVNIITGLIKANVPARIALQVASQTDSRTILDMGGAEKLLGSGDMLYLSPEMAKPVRLQSAFIGESEIKKVVGFLSRQTYEDGPLSLNLAGEGEKNALFDSALETEEDDELYEEARETVIRAGKASTTFLQRKLKIGYARAARIMDILEEKGVVGPGEGAKQREVLIRNDDEGYGREDDADTDDKNSVS